MGTIPRAIYLDWIEDYLLRVEGFSGKSTKTCVEDLTPLYNAEYDCLEIQSRLDRIQAEYESQHVWNLYQLIL